MERPLFWNLPLLIPKLYQRIMINKSELLLSILLLLKHLHYVIFDDIYVYTK